MEWRRKMTSDEIGVHMGDCSGDRGNRCLRRHLQRPPDPVRIQRAGETYLARGIPGSQGAALGDSRESEESQEPHASDCRDVRARTKSLGRSLCDLSLKQREWETAIGKNLYPKTPDMRGPETQSLSDGELYYIIRNGVRMTGMPAWGNAEDGDHDHETWMLVLFIRHLPQLTADEERAMEKLNPKSAAEREEEQEEEDFLNGKTPTRHEQEQ